MSAEIKQKLGLDATLSDVGHGRFYVTVEGEEIWSKAKHGRFPYVGEIVKVIRHR